MADGYDRNKRYYNDNFYEDEGVYYSPRNTKNTSHKPKQRTKKSSTTHSGMFITITIVAGIAICLIVFMLVFSSMSQKSTVNNQNKVTPPDDTISEINDVIEVNALIKEINGNKFDVLNIADEVSYTISISSNTILKDKYGSNMSIAEFNEGDIVQTEFNSQSKEVLFIRISGEAWEHKNITNAIVNADNKTISFGNQKYSFSDDAILLNSSNFSSITEIKPSDTISLKGIRQKVWTVRLEKSHGNILIKNKDKIRNGVLEVDTNIFMQLSEAEKIELTEGYHRVVVKGDNIEPYVKEFEILAHAEVTIDLSKVQIKTGVLILKMQEKDCNVYINDQLITDISEPLVLDYDNYNVRVEKEGFENYSRTVTIDKASVSLNVTLTKLTKIGSITINTIPPSVGADVYIDNAYIGVAPVTAQVEQGEHRILVRKSGYLDVDVPVTVNETPQDVTIRLEEILPINNSNSNNPGSSDIEEPENLETDETDVDYDPVIFNLDDGLFFE